MYDINIVTVPFACCSHDIIRGQAQSVAFKDVDYSELVRVEVRGMRKIGENPVLGSLEFEVSR